jgi:hypothetical protein
MLSESSYGNAVIKHSGKESKMEMTMEELNSLVGTILEGSVVQIESESTKYVRVLYPIYYGDGSIEVAYKQVGTEEVLFGKVKK